MFLERHEDLPSRRPAENCSSKGVSTLANFLRSSNFFCAFLDLFLLRLASSASVWNYDIAGETVFQSQLDTQYIKKN